MLGALSSAHTASVAQMDRVSVSEAEGRGFESRRARHMRPKGLQCLQALFLLRDEGFWFSPQMPLRLSPPILGQA